MYKPLINGIHPVVMSKINTWFWSQLSIPKELRAGRKMIFVDESATGDGKSAMIGGIIVQECDVKHIREEIIRIQIDVLQSMREYNYPILDVTQPLPRNNSRCKNERERLISGNLPELHAAELWHSADVFQTSRPPRSGQFEHHLNWIETTLSLLPRFSIFFRPSFVSDVPTSLEKRKMYTTSTYEQLRNIGKLTEDVDKERADTIVFDPYLSLQLTMLIAIDADAQRWGWKVKLFADKGKKTEILKKLVASFGSLKSAGLLDTFPVPDFKDSHDKPMLQLADLATYIYFRFQTMNKGHRHYQYIKYLYEKYIAPRVLGNLAPNVNGVIINPRHYAIYKAIEIEITLVHSGIDQRTLRYRKQLAIEQIAELINQLKSGRL